MTTTDFQWVKDSSNHHILNSIYLLSTQSAVFSFEISAKNYFQKLMAYPRVIRSFFFFSNQEVLKIKKLFKIKI